MENASMYRGQTHCLLLADALRIGNIGQLRNKHTGSMVEVKFQWSGAATTRV